MKKTLVLGASTNPERYSYKAAHRLLEHGHEIVLLGKRGGEIQGHEIAMQQTDLKGIDTVTLYLNPQNQKEYYSYILSLHPKRIIFNPGSENPELESLASSKGIETEVACTLVLLSTGSY